MDDFEKHGLKIDDVPKLFHGAAGLAVVVEMRSEGDDPLPIVLGWVEPGEDLAGRLIGAIADAVEEQAETENPVTRTDLELEGRTVMHLAQPRIGMAPPRMDDDADDAMLAPDAAPRLIGRQHVMITQWGGRLLVATTASDASPSDDNAEDASEDDEIVVESLAGTFARFLAAHQTGDGAFARRLAGEPGLAEARPRGDVAIEMVGDLAEVDHIIRATADQPQVAVALDKTGFDRLGVVAFGLTVDQNIVRSGMFLHAPSPRPGLLALFDQPVLDPEPPAWVSAEAMAYSHFSLDLGSLYKTIKEIAIAAGGDEMAFPFEMAEQQATTLLATDIATFLSSLGNRHTLLSFTPGFEKVDVDGEGSVEPVETPSTRIALVWSVKDEALWQRVITKIGQFAPMYQGALQPAQEQGYTGWRLGQPSTAHGGIMFGNGKVVFAVGKDVLASTLSALNTPPKGDAALANSAPMRRASELMDLHPGLMFRVYDMSRYGSEVLPHVLDTMHTALVADREGSDAAMLDQIWDLIPTAAELAHAFGVSATQCWVTDNGVRLESCLELPPPE